MYIHGQLWSETQMLIQLEYIYHSGKAWQIEANKSCNNNNAPYDPNLNFSVAQIFCWFCWCASSERAFKWINSLTFTLGYS